MKKAVFILSVGLMCGAWMSGFATLYSVEDDMVNGTLTKDLESKGVLDTDMINQLNELQSQTKRLDSEIKKLSSGDFTESTVTKDLKDVDDLIHQAETSKSYTQTGQFGKNYNGYQSDPMSSYQTYTDENGVERSKFDVFYQTNTNTTLQTINDSNAAIEKDKENNDETQVNTTIDNVKNSLTNPKTGGGTTEAVSNVAEINIEILKQLQSMHAQLAAMAEAQNAAMGKKIDEDAKEESSVRKSLDDNAVPVSVAYGASPLKDPKF